MNEAFADYKKQLREVSGIVWQSTVLAEMVEHLNDNEISLLVNALNDAVAEICESYDIK